MTDSTLTAFQQGQAEITPAVSQLISSVMVLEMVMEDLLDMIADADPDRLSAMRDHAAASFSRIKDAGPDGSEAWLAGLHHGRWRLLDAVLTRTGRPDAAAEVVDLAAFGRASSDAAEGETEAK